jgi:hypothetical protein
VLTFKILSLMPTVVQVLAAVERPYKITWPTAVDVAHMLSRDQQIIAVVMFLLKLEQEIMSLACPAGPPLQGCQSQATRHQARTAHRNSICCS